eukprot:466198-Prorocentrum_minimum.AAC.28
MDPITPIPGMFQLMVYLRRHVNLRDVSDELRAKDNVNNVKNCQPGALGREVSGPEFQIGSVQFKVPEQRLSVFVFNSKIKVSGGLRSWNLSQDVYTDEGRLREWLLDNVVEPVVFLVCGCEPDEAIDSWALFLMNASVRYTAVNKNSFPRVCEVLLETARRTRVERDQRFEVTVNWPTVHVDPVRRGRIFSVGVVFTNWHNGKKIGSIRFDHSGKAQLFAFRAVDDMMTCAEWVASVLTVAPSASASASSE